LTARSVPYHHHVQLDCTLGALHLRIAATFEHAWSILFGPSGSGKSTVLRALCGLLPNAHAKVLRGDPPGEHNIDITNDPPRRRAIAYAPQQPSLFPHLTVADNVAFAQRASRTSSPSQEKLNEAIKLFRLEKLLHRYPRNLSGGQQQLVNLARAFCVPNPQLMLLDEPFNGIDRPLRDAILPELREALRLSAVPVVSVTHDVEEAFLLNAEVFRIEAGRIHAQGHVSKVLAGERLSILNTLR
jgi:molybdate transport system ATP-binding protein